MSSIFSIDNTAGTLSFSVNPGELDGPAGVKRTSDLHLYGMGVLTWGQGVDQNFYRLLETFACPEKELNDYNPNTLLFDYDPTVDPILPKDENDLGFGKGITVPVNGQLWFNDTDKKIYVYDSIGSEWKLTAGVAFGLSNQPLSPEPGNLWYDDSVPQLKIWNGSAWESIADRYLLLNGTSTMTGNIDVGSNYIVNLLDPVNPQDGATKSYIDSSISSLPDYVNVTGDIMTGNLTMNADIIMNGDIDMNSNQIRDVGDPTDGTQGMSRNYADSRYVNVAGDTMTGDLNMSGNQLNNVADPVLSTDAMSRGYADSRYLNITGDTMTGFLTLNADPTAALHAATKQYVDGLTGGNFVDVSGDTMTGFLTLNADPTAALHAATKQYVDSVAGGGIGVGIGQSWTNVLGSRTVGVTYTNTTGSPIQVTITLDFNGPGEDVEFRINGNIIAELDEQAAGGTADTDFITGLVIPNGATYGLFPGVLGYAGVLRQWWELR